MLYESDGESLSAIFLCFCLKSDLLVYCLYKTHFMLGFSNLDLSLCTPFYNFIKSLLFVFFGYNFSNAIAMNLNIIL